MNTQTFHAAFRVLLFALLGVGLWASCASESAKTPRKKSAPTSDTTLVLADNIPDFRNDQGDASLINFTDANGWKQGKWLRKWKGKLVELYTYVNDTLHGPYETSHGEGYYNNGLRHGFQFAYYGEKESILMVNYYTNGEHVWGGFPAAGSELLIPVKEFHISVDSTYVKAPYINGQTWYEGGFCLLPDSLNYGRLLPHRYGIHKIYHMNGQIKGVVDYERETIHEFDSLGRLKYQARFDEAHIHRLPTLGRYKKRDPKR